ncbi:MAG: hypothetical protein ACC661_05085, partial [Verrucomicrobiales bacterium]
MTESPREIRSLSAIAGLVLLVVLVFGTTLSHDFVRWDDQLNFYENPHLTGDTEGGIGWCWKGAYEGLYIPLTYSLWTVLWNVAPRATDLSLSPQPIADPAVFHLANLLVHLGSVLLVYHLLLTLLGRKKTLAAALGAALFAVHPLMAEPVSWVTGMKDLLSGFLGIAALCFYVHASQRAGKKKFPGGFTAYWVALALFALAMLAKPGAVVLPALAWLIDVLVLGRGWKKSLKNLLPFVGLAVLFSIITFQVQGEPDPKLGYPAPDPILFANRPILALYCLALYAGKVLYPLGLVPQYPITPEEALTASRAFPIWAIPLLALVFLWRIRHRWPYLFAGSA